MESSWKISVHSIKLMYTNRCRVWSRAFSATLTFILHSIVKLSNHIFLLKKQKILSPGDFRRQNQKCYFHFYDNCVEKPIEITEQLWNQMYRNCRPIRSVSSSLTQRNVIRHLSCVRAYVSVCAMYECFCQNVHCDFCQVCISYV